MNRAALLLLTATATAGALDFRPVVIENIGEGGRYRYLQFRDEGRAVTYMPPKAWTFHGDAARFCLTVPQTTGVEIDISAVAVTAPMPVEAANVSAFVELARQALPAEAAKVEKVAASFNPLILDGHATVEVIFDYVIFGGPVRVSQLYAARGEGLVCFRVVARPADFDRLHETFRLSLHSFAGL